VLGSAPHLGTASAHPQLARLGEALRSWFPCSVEDSKANAASGPHQAGDDLAMLDRLQDKMEERLARLVPDSGTFCGYCYGRLRGDESRCPFCARDIAETQTVASIPQDVLRAYRAKQRVEVRWVYSFGFIGLVVSSVLFVVLVAWGPGLLGHPGVALTVLVGGGYLLARLLGEVVGGHFGVQRALQVRNRMWLEFVARRDKENPGL